MRLDRLREPLPQCCSCRLTLRGYSFDITIGKYDPTDAWPVLVDEWVDWIEEVGHEAAGLVANKPLARGATIDLTG